MSSWATKRKYGYFLAFMACVALFVAAPVFYFLYTPPTCFDGKQNGGERGLDCGGSCVRLCVADFAAPRILWSYSMRIVPGVYNSLAYVQNPNQSVQTSISYLFKLYDSEGILVAERAGRTSVPAGQKFAIFEGGIRTGERIPARTSFEFTSEPDWRTGTALSSIRTVSVNVATGTMPRAEAQVRNESPDTDLSDISAFIVLYDKNDNRVAFSKTVLSSIGPAETRDLYFTWPEPFPAEIIRSEVLFVASP